MTDLKTIFDKHDGKVSDKWEHYLAWYEKLFATKRDRSVRLLEIGVQNGGSLEIWAKYFENAETITGIDIDPRVAELEFDDSRIRVIVGDATKSESIDAFGEEAFPLDVVIDDGSHLCGDVIRSFLLYFPLLADNGVYVVEDVHASYFGEFGGALFEPTSTMTFFQRIADAVNREHWSGRLTGQKIIEPLLALRGIEAPDLRWIETIHSISFTNSLIAIEKAPAIDNVLGHQIIAGAGESVEPGRLDLNGRAYDRAQLSNKSDPSTGPATTPEEDAAAMRAELAWRDEQLEQMVSDHQQLANEKQKLASEKDGALSELARMHGAIDAMRQSTSWRVTSPARAIGNQARRAKRMVVRLGSMMGEHGGFNQSARKAISLIRQAGPGGFVRRFSNEFARSGMKRLRVARPEDYQLDMGLVENGPCITVIIPVYDTPPEFLNACINSVRNQIYANWQLILIDDCSPEENVRNIMRSHAEADTRITCIFRTANGNISAAINSGMEKAQGDYFTILDHDDVIDPAALYWIAVEAIAYPDADYIYSDEDKLSDDGKRRFGAFYKPQWSPEYMLSMMYTCHMSVFRTVLWSQVGEYRSEFDGAQDYDFALRVLARTDRVRHIPKVLYHWRTWANSTSRAIDAKPYAVERQKRALQDYLASKNEVFSMEEGPLPGHHAVTFLPRDNPLISIVVPTANGSITLDGREERHIDALCASIFGKTTYENFEIIIVHNNDLADNQTKEFQASKQVHLVDYTEPEFSLARKINAGASIARGEYLLILNDDVRVITPQWLDWMLGMAQREGVGAVGAKLLFPDQSIQHAGVTMLGGLPGHAYYGAPEAASGYGLGAMVDRNCIAVTGACQMTPKALFEELDGYNERYPLNYNDVDYCLRLHQLGYRSVYLANVKLLHYEGVSKAGGRSVADDEIRTFLEDWHDVYPHDPYYNPNLSQTQPYGP